MNFLKELPTCEIILITLTARTTGKDYPLQNKMQKLLDTEHTQHTQHSNYIIIDMDGAPFIFWQVVLQLGPPDGSTRSYTAETDGSSDNQDKRQQVRNSGHDRDNKGRDSSREVEMRESKARHSSRVSK